MKNKVTWSLFNLFGETQAEVVQLQTKLKALYAVVISSSMIMANDKLSLYTAIACGILDTLTGCFKIEKNEL